LKISNKKSNALKGIFFVLVLTMGLLSVIWSFEIRSEIDNMHIDNLSTLDPETRQQIEKRLLDWGIEFVFGMVMTPLGGLPLLNLYINTKYPGINHNRERRITNSS